MAIARKFCSVVLAASAAVSIMSCGGNQELVPGPPIVGEEDDDFLYFAKLYDCNANLSEFRATTLGEAIIPAQGDRVSFKMRQVVDGVTREFEGVAFQSQTLKFGPNSSDADADGHFLVYREIENGRVWRPYAGLISVFVDYPSRSTYIGFDANLLYDPYLGASGTGAFVVRGIITLPTRKVKELPASH